MKAISIIIFLVAANISSAQSNKNLGIDCNPKLNSEEITFFSSYLNNNTFDFTGKNIGFAATEAQDGFTYEKKILGFPNSFLPVTKKEYFGLLEHDFNHKFQSKILILDSAQKRLTNGFDAIVLIFDKKYLEKAETTNFRRIITVFGYRKLNYPDNLAYVGNDANNELSEEDVIFFNRIFQHQRDTFDFHNKRIAFVSTTGIDVIKPITKQEFIQRIKKHLEKDFLYPYSHVIILSPQEKIETGGYDVILSFQCKKCRENAIYIVKKGGT